MYGEVSVLSNSVQLEASVIGSHNMSVVPHTVREFGIQARKPGKAWEAAFNGPIQSWIDSESGQTRYAVTIRLSRMKDPETRELFSTNLLFYMAPNDMFGMHNFYDMVNRFPFTRIRGPRTPVPACPRRDDNTWYDPNPEGVIMEDLRLVAATLPNGRQGFFVTGQGYRGKVYFKDGSFIHDVGVYGGYLDPSVHVKQLELQHLFGGIEFDQQRTGGEEDSLLTELADGVWVKGIVGHENSGFHVASYKNSVRLPTPAGGKVMIGARSMSETKSLTYFESASEDGLSGFRLAGCIDGLHRAIGLELWDRVHRVGLGSNFIYSPELDGYIGFIHVVLEKNNPDFPQTVDPKYPGIIEQYEGWVVLLGFDDAGKPVIKSCVRAITPDDIPRGYSGDGELFDTKRVAFPVSLYRYDKSLSVGYGWGDRALFQANFDYETVLRQLVASA